MRLRVEGSSLWLSGVFWAFSQRARELNATGLSPCCLPGSSGGGARVGKSFTQGRNSFAIFRSCSASGNGAWAAVFL